VLEAGLDPLPADYDRAGASSGSGPGAGYTVLMIALRDGGFPGAASPLRYLFLAIGGRERVMP